MKTQVRFMCGPKSKAGMSLTGAMIAAAAIAGLAIVASKLSDNAGRMVKAVQTTSSILDIQNVGISATRNVQGFLNSMRGSTLTGPIYAGCLPTADAAATSYNCPTVSSQLAVNDPELQRFAGNTFHISSTPIVDVAGIQIAGPASQPKYIFNNGSNCTDLTSGAPTCPMQSTGYFLRTTQASNQDPGSVKFLIKVERNPTYQGQQIPFKARFTEINVGQEWRITSSNSGAATCPAGSILMGYLANGPYCVSSNTTCPEGELSLGLDPATNEAICREIPTCGASEHVVIDRSGLSLGCSVSSPCPSGSVLMGFQAGTGDPMCHAPEAQCGANQIQTGFTSTAAGGFEASCVDFPSCSSSEAIEFSGGTLRCRGGALRGCTPGQFVTGIKSDGTLACNSVPGPNESCDDDEIMYGVDENWGILCRPL